MRNLVIAMVLLVVTGGVAAAQMCSVQAYFTSPDSGGSIKEPIIQAIDKTKKNLDIAMCAFTDDQFGTAVIRAARRGVSVRVILAAGQNKVLGGEYEKLVAAGIPVAIASPTSVFSHSFVIIDGRLVITGSYDWSDTPNRNRYDNVVFIRCPAENAGKSIPQQFSTEFDHLWQKFRAKSSVATAESPSSAQSVIIHAVDPAEECIQLLNISTAPVDISGWKLSDLEGSYTFPEGTIIKPDEPYKVCIDTYNPTHDPTGLYLNDEHDEVVLINPAGRIVDERVWGT